MFMIENRKIQFCKNANSGFVLIVWHLFNIKLLETQKVTVLDKMRMEICGFIQWIYTNYNVKINASQNLNDNICQIGNSLMNYEHVFS